MQDVNSAMRVYTGVLRSDACHHGGGQRLVVTFLPPLEAEESRE